MTDTPLDLDAILAAHASASPYGRTEVAGRFHASYYADDADVALVFASIPALIAALRKANAQVAAVLALCDAADEVERLREDVEALHGLLSAGAIGTAPGSDSHRMVLAMRDHYKRQRDASRTAHAALVAELRALCDDSDHGWVHRRDLRALLDRHDPTTGATP